MFRRFNHSLRNVQSVSRKFSTEAAPLLNKKADPPCPIDYYKTTPDQLSPWKIKMMKKAVQDHLIGPGYDSYHYSNNCDVEGLSAETAQIMKETQIDDEKGVPLAMFWNLTEFKKQIFELKSSFPDHFFHTIATKSNPLQAVLDAASSSGAGAEAASLGELLAALKSHPPSRIILDSPAKTVEEIKIALDKGISLTIDNFQELARVDVLRRENQSDSDIAIGMRMNPQIGTGKLATYSVSKPWGKFGLPAHEVAEDVMTAYKARPWLNMIHCHAGSQSYSMEQIASAIKVIVDLAVKINKNQYTDPSFADLSPLERRKHNQVKTLNIGGGLCVNFATEENTPSFKDWSTVLREICPELFTGEFHVITELGRRMLAKQGVIVSQVEYVKECGGRRVVLQHAGADICVRTVYKPESWPLRAHVFDKQGEVKEECPEKYLQNELLYADIAGPCCLDDVIFPQQRPLPEVQQGDYIMLHDTGAYYHSSFSYYNIRKTPQLYVFEENAEGDIVNMKLIRKSSPIDSMVDFFATEA